MKSVFLGLTFLLASFSATTEVKEKVTVEDFICEYWLEVEVECDNNFWLCIDDMAFDEIGDTAVYFMEGRC